ncbi:hypothetical protein P3T76_015640 [Phytophthora citrophthora]|uniref:Uncharacterized protein n=1 Tax=Phytophthora citrophthora TaxID=4793 RepID=A0AAD9LA16_9STRA|nr:hypothetical protein P3T76_015640 [Phytophthora citrophthora]
MSEAARDLTVDASPVSRAQEMAESLPPPELMLRLDDLSQGGTQIASNEEHKSNEEDSPLQQGPGRQVDRDTKRLESQLQRNLKQQQTHYARQRKLFENLRAESSPSSNSSHSPQSSEDQVPVVRQLTSSPRKLVNAAKTKFRLQKERIGTLSRQRTQFSRDNVGNSPLSSPDDDDDDSHAQLMLHRIKEKARAEFYRQHSSTEESSTDVGATAHSKVPTSFFEEMQQQEASNDALRRQLELLRRLQLENNRFRHETRSLRDQNEALKERDEIREREVKRLREDVTELEAKIQRDHGRLATAAQTQQKMKMYQKRLTSAQTEIRDLQTALQEANDRVQAAQDARDQLQSESQLEISDLVLEVKRWKRNTKQLRQQETRSGEEIAICKKTIASLEEESAERRAKLKDAKREIAELATIIDEKTAQCESVETSAADCVKRMEEGLEALQKTHSHEREKRKKVENVRSNMQMQMERMQAENALLLDKQRELEQQLIRFQEHWKDRKVAYQDQLQRFAAQLEEHVTKHKSDAATIGRLRDEYEALENRLGVTEAAAMELKTAVVEEARAAQKQVETLRKYVEKALHDGDESTLETPLDSGRSRREEVWQEVPELQVVQAAVSALRNEIANIVHEFQRARHLVRQQGNKLTLAVERVGELEHLREEDAAKMKELRDQRKLVEQARDIVANEKMEVLKWSEQQCEKNAALEAEIKKCGQLVLRLRKYVHNALKTDEASDFESATTESFGRSFSSLEKEIDTLVSMRDQWRKQSETLSQEVKEAQASVRSLEKEMTAKAVEFKETLEEVERVHSENVEEQKRHFDQCVADVDNERAALEEKFKEKLTKITEEQENNARLQQLVDGFEEDLPVFATILHLFVLVVQPLLLQVSDLLAQKRYLVRENAEFSHSQEQIECIGRVLKEMIPSPAPSQEKTKERQRRRVFRRVVIAVFAMNRLRKFTNSSADIDEPSASVYGLSTPLKAVKARKRTCATSSQPTVIKVLPPHQTLSKLSLRPLLERLKKMEITEKVAEVLESNSPRSSSCLGNLVLKVVMAVNPASKKLLSANTNGVFHCEALLERRRSSRKRPDDNDDMTEYESTVVCEDDMPTVTLIRKRILALGKRVEDLHYQRNALQKENYEFQFQLDEHANSLKEVEVLLKKTEDLQKELAAVRSQSDHELQNVQQEKQAKDQEVQSKEEALVEAKSTIETLQAEVSEFERRIETIEADKTSLRRELDLLKSSSVEEEVKADKSKATARRQEEEMRSLKQAVKKAHDLYQKVTWQLEQEVQEKSTLQTMVNHLRQQQEKAERELREEKLRELEKSFDEDDDSDEDVKESYAKARKLRKSYEAKARALKSLSPTVKSTRNASFASENTVKSRHTRDLSPSRRHQCENSGIPDVSDESENGSPTSASVSPLSLRVNPNKSRYSEEVDKFLNEWQQLGVSGVLSDPAPHGREGHVRFQGEESEMGEYSPAKSPESVPKSRRRVEIDKVNAAVHDYMDRIDDKLSKMYGIPPSSAIQRTSNRNVSKSLETRRDSGDNWDMKANEVRAQQYHSDVGPYD